MYWSCFAASDKKLENLNDDGILLLYQKTLKETVQPPVHVQFMFMSLGF